MAWTQPPAKRPGSTGQTAGKHRYPFLQYLAHPSWQGIAAIVAILSLIVAFATLLVTKTGPTNGNQETGAPSSQTTATISTVRTATVSTASTATVVGSTITPDTTSVPIPRGNTLFTYKDPTSAGEGVEWSPDGNFVASEGANVQIWRAATGELVKTLAVRYGPFCFAWSPDGKRIAIGTENLNATDNIVAIFDVATGKIILTYTGEPTGVVTTKVCSRLAKGEKRG